MGQQALNGVFVGSIYALFAVGYTLVFGVLDILNLAHQAVFMLAAFAALALVADAHIPLWAAMPMAVLFAGLLGIVLERVAFRPLRGRADSNISGLISSLAMATVFEAIALQLFGPGERDHPVLPPMDDEYWLADLAQPLAEVVSLDSLVLANDGVQRHLAEMRRVFLDPVGMFGDEAHVVEIGIAAQRALDRRRVRHRRALAAAAGRTQDQAAHGVGMREGELLQNHPAHRQPKPMRRRFAGIAQHR